jgi:hypothetical protein
LSGNITSSFAVIPGTVQQCSGVLHYHIYLQLIRRYAIDIPPLIKGEISAGHIRDISEISPGYLKC